MARESENGGRRPGRINWKKETEKIGLKKEDALNRAKRRDGVQVIAEGMK